MQRPHLPSVPLAPPPLLPASAGGCRCAGSAAYADGRDGSGLPRHRSWPWLTGGADGAAQQAAGSVDHALLESKLRRALLHTRSCKAQCCADVLHSGMQVPPQPVPFAKDLLLSYLANGHTPHAHDMPTCLNRGSVVPRA
jgi:hypothetical protein